MHSESDMLARIEVGARLSPVAAFVAVAVTLLVVIGVHAPTARSMVAIWSRSDTFAHGFFVLPACLWFIWRQRAALAAAPLRPFLPGLVAVAALGFVWLLGELSGSVVPSQFALVGLAAAAALTVFGLAWFRLLVFPLGFLFFAVPFGEAFVPTLIDWTADFTVAALIASGVPVLREGNELTIPTGRWSVVEACSGVRYLLASAMAGVLYAWLMYRSPRRRALFIVASIAVPIVANWMRAYLIVMLGHLADNRIAAGVDHLIYGWVFFGFVTGLMFVLGARWREDTHASALAVGGLANTVKETGSRAGPVAVVVALLLCAGPAAYAALTSAVPRGPLTVSPIDAAGGWTAVADPVSEWKPTLQQPTAVHHQAFKKAGRSVAVHLGLWRNQRQGAELVSSMNQIVGDAVPEWWRLTRAPLVAVSGRKQFTGEFSELRSRTGGDLALLHWYWTGSSLTASDLRAKADLALDRLLLRDDTSAWVVIATHSDPRQPEAARTALLEFLADMGAEIELALQRTAAR